MSVPCTRGRVQPAAIIERYLAYKPPGTDRRRPRRVHTYHAFAISQARTGRLRGEGRAGRRHWQGTGGTCKAMTGQVRSPVLLLGALIFRSLPKGSQRLRRRSLLERQRLRGCGLRKSWWFSRGTNAAAESGECLENRGEIAIIVSGTDRVLICGVVHEGRIRSL